MLGGGRQPPARGGSSPGGGSIFDRVSGVLGVRAIGQSPLQERTPPHSVLETLRLRSRHGASSTGCTEFPTLPAFPIGGLGDGVGG